MKNLLKRSLLLLAIGVLLASVVTYLLLKIMAQPLPHFRGLERQEITLGAYHIHSDASHDSTESLDSIARAAHTIGLNFVVVTDHNNQLAGPIQLHGVLIISSAELSTPFGHVVQLGANDVLPNAERGELNVHERIRAMGGLPILAHPTDPKRPWQGPIMGAHGLEIANVSSAARRRGGPTFLAALPDLPFLLLHPALALAQLYDRDKEALARWDENPDPRFIGICGNDAHGWIPMTQNLRLWQLVLHEPFLKTAPVAAQSQAVLQAVGDGRFHCSAGLFGSASRLQFGARSRLQWVGAPGHSIHAHSIDELVAVGPSFLEADTKTLKLVLIRNGEVVLHTRGHTLRYPNPRAGTYRVELHLDMPTPWGGQRSAPVAYSNRLRVLPTANNDALAPQSSLPDNGSSL